MFAFSIQQSHEIMANRARSSMLYRLRRKPLLTKGGLKLLKEYTPSYFNRIVPYRFIA